MMGADTVNGNVVLAQGSILENLGISAAPAAVQAQIVGFNLAHGLPATFPGSVPGGLVITQSKIAGFVANAGTIDGRFIVFPDPAFFPPPRQVSARGFRRPMGF
jgi:hypothetical protein